MLLGTFVHMFLCEPVFSFLLVTYPRGIAGLFCYSMFDFSRNCHATVHGINLGTLAAVCSDRLQEDKNNLREVTEKPS